MAPVKIPKAFSGQPLAQALDHRIGAGEGAQALQCHRNYAAPAQGPVQINKR